MPDFEYDPYSYETDEDPYPLYHRMREEAPVYYNERLDFYALTRYDDCLNAFVDWKSYSSARGTVLEMMGKNDITGPLIIFMDPPRQTRIRNLVSKAFTPRRIDALEPQIREIAIGHLEKLPDSGSCEIIGDFTGKLPMDVISTLLGIPAEDRDQVRTWSNGILHREPGNPLPPPSVVECMNNLQAYFRAALAERREQPRDDIMSLLIRAEFQEEDGSLHHLTDEELTGFFNLLATAGNETVTKLLATAFYWLARFPDQRQRLLDDPSLIPTAVDEVLRFDPPSQYQGRTLTRDVELHGEVIPKDGRVMIVNAAGTRDFRQYPEPDTFDVGREIETHLNFGWGQHICLGKNLALMESRIAIAEFLKRIPEYEVPEDSVERMHSSNVRGFSGLTLEY